MPSRALQTADRFAGLMLQGIMLASLSGLLLLVAFVVVTRVFSLASAGWTDELIELLFAWLIFPGAASLWRTKGHFAITLLDENLKSEAAKAILTIVTELACLAFLVVFTYESCVFIAGASEDSPVFSISKAYWYVAMPISGAIMMAYSLARLVSHSVRHFRG